MDSCKPSNSIISNYPNLLEVYIGNKNYLVVDRSIGKESYYCPTLIECVTNIIDFINPSRNPTDPKFQYYLYCGKSFLTLKSLTSTHPEALI